MHLSATSITGTSIRNAANENLGKVEDLMINATSGTVEYAVVSFGGFIGIGNKLFAVPLQALRVDTENKELILNETKHRLRDAPGFDKDHWPDHADRKWCYSVRSYYRVQ